MSDLGTVHLDLFPCTRSIVEILLDSNCYPTPVYCSLRCYGIPKEFVLDRGNLHPIYLGLAQGAELP